jgi:hypothetical protein
MGTARDLRLLVIAATGAEPSLAAIRQVLGYLGTPYDVIECAPRPAADGADRLLGRLATGNHAHYQGIVLATGAVVYQAGASWLSALTPSEWQALASYEARFGVRRIAWYAYPTPDGGFAEPDATIPADAPPVEAWLTEDGRRVFPYMCGEHALSVAGSHTYLARPLDSDTMPLLLDAAGHALAALRFHGAGRETLSLTFDSTATSLHALLLGYGLVSWVTRGLFLGERRVYLNAHVDDVMTDGELWVITTPCGTHPEKTGHRFRFSASDLRTAAEWQRSVQRLPRTADFRLDFAFNGSGFTEWPQPDALAVEARRLKAEFRWINHTWSHERVDWADYPTSLSEITANVWTAVAERLPEFCPRTLITPNLSGLRNPRFLQAAHDADIRYLVTDTSRLGYDNPAPNVGISNPWQPSILMIPRRPNGLWFNVSTPEEWVAEYNSIYRSFWGRDLSYRGILDIESTTLLGYMVSGDIDPWMFHQPNLHAYDGAHSLLSDLLDLTLARYREMCNLPICGLPLDEIGRAMKRRAAYDAAGVTASLVDGEHVIIATRADAVVPITGLDTPGAETYGDQPVSRVALAAGESITIPLSGAARQTVKSARLVVGATYARTSDEQHRAAAPGKDSPYVWHSRILGEPRRDLDRV